MRSKVRANRTPLPARPAPEVKLPPPNTPAAGDPAGPPPAANSLTPDEQMKLFEKELKENDWGHQPC